MANPNPKPESNEEPDWRERGWQSYEGGKGHYNKPYDPELDAELDPYKDDRMNTRLNPSAELPSHPSATLQILGIVLGVIAFVLLIALLYYHWMTPSPRHPGQSSSGATVSRTATTPA